MSESVSSLRPAVSSVFILLPAVILVLVVVLLHPLNGSMPHHRLTMANKQYNTKLLGKQIRRVELRWLITHLKFLVSDQLSDVVIAHSNMLRAAMHLPRLRQKDRSLVVL